MPPPPPGLGGGRRDTTENRYGVISLACGILSIVACPVLLSVVAIVYARRGLVSARAGRADNEVLSRVGLALGIVSLVVGVVLFTWWLYVVWLEPVLHASDTFS